MLLLLRFLKLLAVASLYAGSLGAVLGDTLATRRRFALWLAAPSLLVTWAAGLGLASQLGHSLISGWILLSLAFSIASLNVVLFAVAKDGRRGIGLGSAVFLLLTACLALMVWRPDM